MNQAHRIRSIDCSSAFDLQVTSLSALIILTCQAIEPCLPGPWQRQIFITRTQRLVISSIVSTQITLPSPSSLTWPYTRERYTIPAYIALPCQACEACCQNIWESLSSAVSCSSSLYLCSAILRVLCFQTTIGTVAV
jgi:hypothetical protein